MIKISERGWAGHFFCANSCLFRRNTLIEYGKKRIIVSTVGAYINNDKLTTIGAGGRYYETMAFKARKEGPYWEIDVNKQLSFDSDWSICAASESKLPKDVDNKANAMHDKVVEEFCVKLKNGR